MRAMGMFCVWASATAVFCLGTSCRKPAQQPEDLQPPAAAVEPAAPEKSVPTAAAEVKKEAREAAAAVGDLAVASKDKMQADLRELGEKLDRKLDELKDATDEKAEKAKAELREKRQRVQESLARLKESSAEKWSEIKQETADTAREIGDWFLGLTKETEPEEPAKP